MRQRGARLTLQAMAVIPTAFADLYWLPLGAGGRSVRLNGRVFEAVAARIEGRAACDLYHSALEGHLPETGRFVIEMTPVPGRSQRARRCRGGARGGTLGEQHADLPLRGAALA